MDSGSFENQFRSPGFSRAVCALWVAWMLVLPLGHLTGLRNTLAVVTLILTFAITGLSPWRELPARWALLLFIAWATLSLLWSADPGLTWSKLRTDLFIPIWAYGAAFTWARSSRNRESIFGGLAIGMILLALISMIALLPLWGLDRYIPEARFASLERPIPIWYPGVGDASSYAILCVGPFLSWVAWNSRWRAKISLLIVIATLTAIAVSMNRNALVVLPFAVAAFFIVRAWIQASPRELQPGVSRPHASLKTTIAALVVCALLIAPFLMETVSRERLASSGQPIPPWGHATLTMVSHDPRPRMWQEYLHLGMSHPWVGVGFGRLVPGVAYHTRDDPILTQADPNAFSHAHNIFINLWLQLGLVGVILYLAVFIGIVRWAIRHARANRIAQVAFAGVVTVLLAALLRDLTDDFLIFAMGTVFWVSLGTLLGAQTDGRVLPGTPLATGFERIQTPS